jgi:hypothetical protein
MSIPTSLVVGLEQGVLALLGSKSTRALVKLTPHNDLVLLCCACYAILRPVPAWVPVFGKVSDIMANIVYSIAINTLFDSVVVPDDTGLSCINLLSIFFIGSALQPDNSLTTTSQYLLVSTLSSALQGFKGDSLAIAWALAFVPKALMIENGEQIATLAQLVAFENISSWLRGGLPRETLLPGTLATLYLCAPFISEFPTLGRLYRFAVFAVSNDGQLHSLPIWMLAVGMWILWELEPDPVSKSLAAVAGANLGVLMLLDAMQFAMDNDPGLILISLLLVVRVLE